MDQLTRQGTAHAPAVLPIELPERLRYRLKNKLLGPPLTTDKLKHERLGKVAGLGVLAPDCISSSAYGTEEMLVKLVPFFGLAAFSLVVPITLIILGILLFVTLSYWDVIGSYTKAGGAYAVARDNFGTNVAQIAAVALLIDYTVTVAVQAAAGTAALTSAVPRLTYYTVPITVGIVLLLVYGNLRGIREAGKWFAFPTYFYIFSLGSVVVTGITRILLGQLHAHSTHVSGAYPLGSSGHGILMAASVFVLLKSFANGGSSLTGLEAISNGVSSFRNPVSGNARKTLVIMSATLGTLVLGVTILAWKTHAVPILSGTPTVVSQEVRDVFGHSLFGQVVFYTVQAATVAVLWTGANTSFNGFPFLASFVAGDSFLPRQLTRRGHRLAFSNGILILAVVALALIIATGASLDSLVALYAIGVFTGFTMAGSGMVKHHFRERHGHWRLWVFFNGISAAVSLTVVLIFAITKFTEGAWVVVVLFPVLMFVLIRLNRQYRSEAAQLETGAAAACEVPVLRRHVVVVLVDRLDMATARTIQYARSLRPDDLRAVHFAIDDIESQRLESEWTRLGLSHLPLDIVECPDRRIGRAALELAAEAVSDGDTELTVLLPRREYGGGWQRVLHDRTADQLVAVIGEVVHANATVIPYQLRGGWMRHRRDRFGKSGRAQASAKGRAQTDAASVTDDTAGAGAGREGLTPLAGAAWRTRVTVTGRVKSVRVQPRSGTMSLECVLADATGTLLLVFQGRRQIPGIQPGAHLVAGGMVGTWSRKLAILNPDYELVAGEDDEGFEG